MGGATVDHTLDPHFLNVHDLVRQVTDDFLPNYGTQNLTQWTSANSLFAFWFGINDVNDSYSAKNSTLNELIFLQYSALFDQVGTSIQETLGQVPLTTIRSTPLAPETSSFLTSHP